MGDTQRSPTISTENQGIAAKVAGDSGQSEADPLGGVPPLFEGESSLLRIRMLAESEPDLDRQGRGEKEADRYSGSGGQNRPKGSVYHSERHIRRELP